MLAVYEAAQKAVAECRAGQGPGAARAADLSSHRATRVAIRVTTSRRMSARPGLSAIPSSDSPRRFSSRRKSTSSSAPAFKNILAEAVERAKVAPHPERERV